MYSRLCKTSTYVVSRECKFSLPSRLGPDNLMATLDQADRTAVVVGVSELWHGVHMGRASSHHTTT